MEVVITPPAQGARLVAQAVSDHVRSTARPALGVATGSSPLPVYQALAARGDVDLSPVSLYLLDEYVGLPAGHPQSYREVVLREVAAPLGVPATSVHGPDVAAADLSAACRAYDEAVRTAAIGVQLLGVGTDGHIGFNEPGSSLGSRTRVKTLSERTRSDNARFFDGSAAAVPRHVVTQGIDTILRAAHLVLLAWGAGKADAVARLVEGPVTAMTPASALQLHPHVTVVVDDAAASRLAQADYYRETFAAKPAWQGL